MRERDRALETLIADELAGRRPPDLTERILAAARRDATTASSPPRSSPRTARRSLAVGLLLGGIAVAGVWSWWATSSAATRHAPRVQGEVARGILTWEPAARSTPTRTVEAGAPFALLLAAGDRLRNVGSETLVVSIDRMGELVLEPNTCLEVKHVDWKPLTGGFVAGSITVSALIGSASWFGDGELIDDPSRDVVLAATKGADPADPMAASGMATDLAAAQERIAELEAALHRRQPLPQRSAPAEPLEAVETAPNVEPILTDSEFDELLASIDWLQVGSAIDGYLEAQKEIERLIASGEAIPLELRATADGFENQLFQQVATTLESGVPGATLTARIHHPAIAANLFASVMNAAGVPLDASQRRLLEDIGRHYTSEDAARRSAYNDRTLKFEQFVDEIEMQHRLFAEQRRVLRADQEAVLSFGELGERAGIDPFGSGYQWSKKNRVIEVASRDALADRAALGFADELNLDDDQRASLRPMVERWAASWPDEWMNRPMDRLDRNGRMHIERIRSAARLQVDLMREMSYGLGLRPEQFELLRRQVLVFVPFLTR